MNRFLLIKAFAILTAALLGTQAQADGHGSKGMGGPGHGSMNSQHGSMNSQHGSMNSQHGTFNHSFKASGRFDYGRHGFKSLSWTKYGWSNRYNSYCYWAPNYGWCFYEPTYSCYLPVSYYQEVYPQAVLTAAPTVVQQTDVILSAPPVPVNVPEPVVPAPNVVQQTKVLAGAGPLGNVPPGPVGPGIVPTPGVVQQNKVGPIVP